MNNLAVKEVNFNDDILMAAQNKETDKIYVGIRWVCEGLGLTVNQAKRQIKNVKEDLVLSKGVSNLTLPTNGGVQDVLCIELDFLPLWLAKISLTPKMQKDQPFIINKLVDYQLKAKDVLAEAFIKNNQLSDQLSFLQGLLDNMKEKELRLQKLEVKSEQMDSKVIKLETELNKETVIEGYKTNDNLARKFNLYSKTNKPHASFIDAVAMHLKIHRTTAGYKDEYIAVRRERLYGGSVGIAVYYSDKAEELIKNFLDNKFNLTLELYKRGEKKDSFKEAYFKLDGTNFYFNEETYHKW